MAGNGGGYFWGGVVGVVALPLPLLSVPLLPDVGGVGAGVVGAVVSGAGGAAVSGVTLGVAGTVAGGGTTLLPDWAGVPAPPVVESLVPASGVLRQAPSSAPIKAAVRTIFEVCDRSLMIFPFLVWVVCASPLAHGGS